MHTSIRDTMTYDPTEYPLQAHTTAGYHCPGVREWAMETAIRDAQELVEEYGGMGYIIDRRTGKTIWNTKEGRIANP